MAINRIKLMIAGSSYIIATNDDEAYLQSLAERIDKDIADVMARSPSASVTKAAVLTALSYLDEARKASNGADNMRAQIKSYSEDASRAVMEADQYRKEVAQLKRDLKDALAGKTPKLGEKPVNKGGRPPKVQREPEPEHEPEMIIETTYTPEPEPAAEEGPSQEKFFTDDK